VGPPVVVIVDNVLDPFDPRLAVIVPLPLLITDKEIRVCNMFVPKPVFDHALYVIDVPSCPYTRQSCEVPRALISTPNPRYATASTPSATGVLSDPNRNLKMFKVSVAAEFAIHKIIETPSFEAKLMPLPE
jgi:hypothetical protein